MLFNEWKSCNVQEYLKNSPNNIEIKVVESLSPILIKKFDNFEEIKHKTIELINKSKQAKSEFFPEANVNISKSDYKSNTDINREWLINIEEPIVKNISFLSGMLGYSSIKLSSLWFQQYEQSSTHGWHIHFEDHYSGVFYLEMPENGPKTEFYNTIENKIYSLDMMNEGDIAIFPSYFPHRSAPNKSKLRKTIVSFNFSFGLPDFQQNILNEMSNNLGEKNV